MIISLGLFTANVFVLTPALGNHDLWLAFILFMATRAITLWIAYPRIWRSLDIQAPDTPQVLSGAGKILLDLPVNQ